jgi:hypothetical protein
MSTYIDPQRPAVPSGDVHPATEAFVGSRGRSR